MKILRFFKPKFGYIYLTLTNGRRTPVNIRAIMRYDESAMYENRLEKLHTKLTYLDGRVHYFIETRDEIDEIINKTLML